MPDKAKYLPTFRPAPDKKNPTPNEFVQTEELKQIAARREVVRKLEDVDPAEPRKALDPNDPLKAGLVGLAFSGGGIRSATFNLGILQALGQLKLLARIDYLSTVSGGGYIGAWLAAWISRAPGTAPEEKLNEVQTHLDTQWTRTPGRVPEAEPEPVQHLREHSRFLALNSGVMTLDMWSLLTIYVRNVFINLLVLVPVLLFVVFAARWILVAASRHGGAACVNWGTGLFALLLGVVVIGTRLFARIVGQEARTARVPNSEPSEFARGVGPSGFRSHAGLIAATLLIAFLGVWLPRVVLVADLRPNEKYDLKWKEGLLDGKLASLLVSDTPWGAFVVLGGMFAALFLFLSPFTWLVVTLRERRYRKAAAPLWGAALWDGTLRYSLGVLLNGFVFGAVYAALVRYGLFYDPALNFTVAHVAFGVPLFMLAVLAGGYVEVAVAGRTMDEFEREWRSRVSAVLFRLAFVWALLFATIAYIPHALRTFDPAWLNLKENKNPAPWAAAVGWLVTTLGGFLLARRATAQSNRWLMLVVRVVPLVFLVGLFAAGSELSVLLASPDDAPGERPRTYLERLSDSDFEQVSWRLLVTGAIALIAVLLVPANLFSLHSLYLNRLTRCYLGASRTAPADARLKKGTGLPVAPVRQPNLFSGFDPRDDLPLTELRGTPEKPYPGPYPLINTTLNLVGGDQLAYQDRKGASFVLTPDYCGSEETGYARLLDLDGDAKHKLTLGRAMTISGAAVDPNMKDHQSGPLTLFLTVLNARLGWWIENPKKLGAEWTGETAGSGASRYLQEMAGYTTADLRQVHLSDGGHFDASGAYELIRRRCRYVIAIDAAEDTDDASENLADLIRLVRADFGVEIEIDTSPLRKDDKGISRAHCAIGTIRYDLVDPKGVVGTFVFVRSSLTGDESADLRNYTNTKPPFPHHSTGDQFFDGAQFESYRKLGEHIGLNVLREAVNDIERLPGGAANRYREYNRQLFANLRRQWSPRPPSEAGYLSSCRDYLRATEHLRDAPGLRPLTGELFPELPHIPPRPVTSGTAPPPPAPPLGSQPLAVELFHAAAGKEEEVHAVDSLFQVMELAWIENNLANHYSNPLHRGWMNVLRRWTASEALHRYWPVLRSQYSRGFVRFCERALNLDRLPVQWCPLAFVPNDSRDRLLKQFDAEFHREWSTALRDTGLPEEDRMNYLSRAVSRAELCDGTKLAWVITTGRGGDKPGETPWSDRSIPLGLVTAFYTGPVDPPVMSRELLVWIRCAHRTIGLARDSVPELLRASILPALERCCVRQLFARYPRLGDSTGDRSHQTMWAQFFNDLGFVRDEPAKPKPGEHPRLKEIRLVLNATAKES